ncbi:MAG: hypothetical protein ACI35S_00065 [Anaeroplasma sp.]
MDKINITAGEALNELLTKKEKGIFIPFNEAMIEGEIVKPLFSNEFIAARALHHSISTDEYRKKLRSFINLLKKLDYYDEIVLWFGDEPFCNANRSVVLECLKEHNYTGIIKIHIVDEETGEILKILSE